MIRSAHQISNVLRLLFRKQRVEDELDQEVQAYFGVLEDQGMEQGLTKSDAQRAARLRYEGVEQVKERVRDARLGAALESIWRDVRYAVRMLSKKPAFSIVAICSLAIGIGATAATYSFADAILLRPLPVPRAKGIVAVTPLSDQLFAVLNTVSYPDYADLRDRNRTFAGLVADAYSFFGFAVNGTAQPRMKFGMFVSGNFFQVLGVEPVRGRAFRAEEDEGTGRDAVAVISHELWMSEYNGRDSVVGETVRLNGLDFTIIGVAPESFTGTDQFLRPALYVPFALSARLVGSNNLNDRQIRWLTLKGRLRPGVSIAQAQADLSSITASLRTTYPDADGTLRVRVESQLQYQTEFSPPTTATIAMLGLLAACVLMVACANVAGLLLSRSATRAREIAVRLAIGAGRGVLLRQLLLENLVLALAGGVAGLALAYSLVGLFNRFPISSDLPFKLGVAVDGRVLLFTTGTSILSAFLFGLTPALRATKLNLTPALRATGVVSSKQGRLWGRNLLVSGQVALSLLLLIVSTILVQGFQAELASGPGFRIDRLFLMSFNTTLVRYTDAQKQQFYKQLLDKTRLTPNVTLAALASSVPLGVGGVMTGVVPEGVQLKPGQEAISVFHNIVSDGYFETIALPITQGRSFTQADQRDTLPVAIVNEQFAEHYWPGRSAIGKRLRLRNAKGPLVQIVGVAKTAKYISISEAPLDFLYLPFSQNPQSQMSLIAESAGPSATALFGVLRRLTAGIDRNMPIYDARSMRDMYENRAVRIAAIFANVVGGLGMMGVLLALIGLYGLVSYSVNRRTREIGIRMAIGADRPSVLRMVLGQGLTLGLVGAAAGLLLGIFANRALQSMAFVHFGRTGLVPFTVVPALLLLTILAATYLPARRASCISPTRALREE